MRPARSPASVLPPSQSGRSAPTLMPPRLSRASASACARRGWPQSWWSRFHGTSLRFTECHSDAESRVMIRDREHSSEAFRCWIILAARSRPVYNCVFPFSLVLFSFFSLRVSTCVSTQSYCHLSSSCPPPRRHSCPTRAHPSADTPVLPVPASTQTPPPAAYPAMSAPSRQNEP